jgi:hypothetical protein
MSVEYEAHGAIAEMVHYHDKILVRGNGKSGLMTRMETQEHAMEAIVERCDATDTAVRERFEATNKRLDSTQKMFWAIILLLVTTLGTTIAELTKDRAERMEPAARQSTAY